ncbi:MAG: class I SAM-dependent methyltransferase [Deltaproteobacteria bacterium]|nr:class I SAM-dependent methyltransferase [Deltaproteobacteria bacterium]
MSSRYPGSRVEVRGWEARYYDLLMNIITLWRYPPFIREVISLMKIKPADKIIDFGCGTGRNACLMLEYLSPQGELIGLEISAEMTAQFRTRCDPFLNARVLEMRIDESLTFKEEFDKVFISFVLHGFPQEVREVIVANAHRTLKPKGELFLLDYNEFSLQEAPFYFRIPFRHLECSYAADFIARDWYAVLSHMGFEDFAQHLFFRGYVRLLKARKKPTEKKK